MKVFNFRANLSFHLALIFTSFSIFLYGCSSKEKQIATTTESFQDVSALDSPPPVPGQAERQTEKAANSNPTLPDQTKIIRNASIRFQVGDYRKAYRNIEGAIKRYQGMVVSSNETRIESNLQNTLSIRVPAKNLDNLVEELSKQAIYIDHKNISSEDVSVEFVDVSARMKAKLAVEQRYLDLLRQAKSIKEILEVETQLRQIREEIESGQARLNYISSQVAYSTISLEIYDNETVTVDSDGFGVRLLNALKNGWEILLSLLIGLLNIWPLLLLLPLLVYGLRKFFRKYPPVK